MVPHKFLIIIIIIITRITQRIGLFHNSYD